MRLKQLGLLAIFCRSSFLSNIAYASIVSYDFTATIYKVREFDPSVGEYQDVVSSQLLGVPVSNGNTVTGSFSYDTGAHEQFTFLPPNVKMYTSSGEKIGMDFTIVESGVTYHSNADSAYVVIANNSPYYDNSDAFKLGSWTEPYPVRPTQSGRLDFFDASGMIYGDWSIPATLSLTDFSSARMSGDFTLSDNQNMIFFANINTLNPTQSEVPEPETLSITLLGLALMQRVVRRKKT